MKNYSIFIISILVLSLLIFVILIFDSPAPPVISKPSGFYTQSFTVSLSSRGHNETIHYTLDGSIPTIDSPVYNEPIVITDRANDPNDISMIRTISYRYREPVGNVKKITTLRARSINNLTKAESQVLTKTYLVGDDILDQYTLPIISLVVDPKDFFDPAIGIYVTGEEREVSARADEYYFHWPANYSRRGKAWEKNVYIEYFDTDGTKEFSQNAGIRIHGGASRSFRQKSFRLYARREYDILEEFNFPLFPNLTGKTDEQKIDSFTSFILRNSGTDFGASFMRDVMIQRLVDHTSAATQATNPVIVFLNGEFWGLYFLYEHHRENYFYDHFRIEPKNLILLENQAEVVIGGPKDREKYLELEDYIRTNDVNDPLVYSEISRKIDIDNFIDYQIIQIYSGNTDWPATNIKFWRSRTITEDPTVFSPDDGRWRWLLYDLDHGFQYLDVNGMEHATNERYPTTILRTLVKNPDFNTLFLNRFSDHINTTFQTDRVIQVIDEIEVTLKPEMKEQIDRWHSSGREMRHWHNNVEFLRIFARERPEIMIRHLIDFFDLEGTYTLKVDSDVEGGFVRINSIDILPSTPGIEADSIYQGVYFKDIPLMIRAIPIDGYEFSHWEGTNNDFKTEALIELVPGGDFHLQPVFVPVD